MCEFVPHFVCDVKKTFEMDMHEESKPPQQLEKKNHNVPPIIQRTLIRPDVCNVIQEDGSKCTETKTLAILHEFNQIYHDKIEHIDKTCGDIIEVGLKPQHRTNFFYIVLFF